MGKCVICKQPLNDVNDMEFIEEEWDELGGLKAAIIVHGKCKIEYEEENTKKIENMGGGEK